MSGSGTNPIPGQRRMGRVIEPGMTLEQAYKLGYNQGYSKGLTSHASDYKRVCEMLAEERALTTKLKARVRL